MKGLFFLPAFLALIFFSCKDINTDSRVFYVDSVNGNNTNTGLSESDAWASLERLNVELFSPGDKILFKSGTEYVGQFEPKGSGAKDKPIIVDVFGKGAKPIINGLGQKLHTVLIENIQFWEINNLEITNLGQNYAPKRNGIVISAHNFGEMEHIHLKNITIRDVNGSIIKSEGGGNGIYWNCGGQETPSRFKNLLIEDCHIYNCHRNGITGNGNSNRDKWFPSIDVVIRGNLIEKVPGDGIVPIACDGALIENNIMRDSPDLLGMDDAAAGIWPWSSDNTIIQYNEVSGHKAKWDAQGFDSDYNCKNTIIKYNFSHDNNGGMILICNDGESLGKPWNHGTIGTKIYGNISINDGLRPYPTRPGWFSPIIHISGPTEDTQIENNIFIMLKKEQPDLDRTVLEIDNWGGPWPKNTTFKNNLFYIQDNESPYNFNLGKGENTIFENNMFNGSFTNKPYDIYEEEYNYDLFNEFPFPEEFPYFLRKRVLERLEETRL